MHQDQQYIEALLNNDERGIREIYRQHAPAARRWVLQHGGNTDDAQDVFQEAVMAVFERARKSNFVLTCPLGALLHVIYTRKWVDRIRQKDRDMTVRNVEEYRYELESSEPDALTVAEEAIEAQQRQSKLARTFAQLSQLCQQLFNLLAEGIPPREAAEKLQMNSVDTLYRRKNACSERWRALMLD